MRPLRATRRCAEFRLHSLNAEISRPAPALVAPNSFTAAYAISNKENSGSCSNRAVNASYFVRRLRRTWFARSRSFFRSTKKTTSRFGSCVPA